MKILLIAGGWSTEREVSLSGAQAMRQALTARGHNVTLFDLLESFDELLATARVHDFALINLHGAPGEDGLVQAMLGLGIVPGARHAGNDGCGSHHDRPLDDEAEPHDEDDGAHAVRDVDGVLGVHPYFSGDEKVGRGDEKAQQLFQEWPESNHGDLPGQG